MSTIKANQWLNPDGTENYKCRAWVNFNGIGTVAILAAGNVSSITDVGVGDYRANLATAMPDVNYAMSGAARGITGLYVGHFSEHQDAPLKSVSMVPMFIVRTDTGGALDSASVSLVIHR